jgi:hypothetical protein
VGTAGAATAIAAATLLADMPAERVVMPAAPAAMRPPEAVLRVVMQPPEAERLADSAVGAMLAADSVAATLVAAAMAVADTGN